MNKSIFTPHHINATEDDFEGNNGIGRYILLPGSEGRAREIAQHFENLQIKQHPRQHNLYLGTILADGKKIDVATVASGMGCPSTEIIVHELFSLGAKRFLRVGTAGTLQTRFVEPNTIVNAQAAVRDESTTRDYVPVAVPAIASLEFVTAILVAAEKLNIADYLHTGIVHCKGSLYARELGAGPLSAENQNYLNLLTQSGVLASEMETSILFVLAQLYNYQLMHYGDEPRHRVLAGALLTILGGTAHFADSPDSEIALNNTIELALEAVKVLASQELMD